MRKVWYRRNASIETAWNSFRDFRFGFGVISHADADPAHTTVSAGLGFISIWIGLPIKLFRRRKNDYRELVYGWSLYRIEGETVFTWSFHKDRHSWSSRDPWYRYSYVVINEAILGIWDGYNEIIEEDDAEWVDSIDNTVYDVKLSLSRYVQHRTRFSFIKRVFHRIEVELDPECNGTGVPVPGKGENSWDCGDTTTSSISFGMGFDPIPEDWKSWCLLEFTNDISNKRLRHGGRNWKPSGTIN